MNIYLIGYRATGKTTVGSLLADRLGWVWADNDLLIQEQTGQTIAEIFEQQGEAGFRDLETTAVGRIAQLQNHVVSLGGGAILREQNRESIRGSGKVVWLTADVQTIARRLSADPDTVAQRPGLTDQGVIDEIEQVLSDRLPIYREMADLEIDTVSNDPEQIAARIVEWFQDGS